MSAPHTNLEKQKQFHRAPLVGISLVVIFAVALLVFWLFGEVGNAENPGEDIAAELPSTSSSVDQGSVTTQDSQASDSAPAEAGAATVSP